MPKGIRGQYFSVYIEDTPLGELEGYTQETVDINEGDLVSVADERLVHNYKVTEVVERNFIECYYGVKAEFDSTECSPELEELV